MKSIFQKIRVRLAIGLGYILIGTAIGLGSIIGVIVIGLSYVFRFRGMRRFYFRTVRPGILSFAVIVPRILGISEIRHSSHYIARRLARDSRSPEFATWILRPSRSVARTLLSLPPSPTEREVLSEREALQRLIHADAPFRLNNPFKYRLDELYTKLEKWKPASFWELRYAGYGGFDPVGVGAFYAVGGALILTIIIVALASAQTYAAFKMLNATTPS